MSTEKGIKLDDNKDRWDLLPLELIEQVIKVLTFGANKYTDNGWQSVPNGYNRYRGALLRHLVAAEKGILHDEETGLYHLAHMATNALFMLHFKLKEDNELRNVDSN